MCGPGSGSGTLLDGGVSEWPKEHASKACDGLRRPRVQIPPPPPTLLKRRRGPPFAGLSCGWLLGFAGRRRRDTRCRPPPATTSPSPTPASATAFVPVIGRLSPPPLPPPLALAGLTTTAALSLAGLVSGSGGGVGELDGGRCCRREPKSLALDLGAPRNSRSQRRIRRVRVGVDPQRSASGIGATSSRGTVVPADTAHLHMTGADRRARTRRSRRSTPEPAGESHRSHSCGCRPADRRPAMDCA